ncbi:M48 family metallopeptidase [Qipengyuania sp. 1NDH17]|uniref:M48 family metallopeptidase n=1 Tax=Qipengyuania polymorpha TaxID=2867234 RepID=A0ABS7J1J7_9SPHN|nr:M48 family metallopeptidase [Qipengyuania polymorpha]MBX7458622.1 M48 family metallopeptidase [Qipengyuania polymorpha]
MEESFRTPAQWYDGHSAVRHEGDALWDGARQLALRSTSSNLDIALGELVFAEERGGQRVYRWSGDDDFRLILPADLPAGLAAALPSRRKYGAWVDGLGLGKATVLFAGVSAGLLALFFTAPDWLGPRIPTSWERSMGDALVGDFGNRICHTPEGDAALAKLLAKVDPAEEKVRAGIANSTDVNAVALPGGQILIFDGLVQEAETPEELAGVLGHEVGHVRERHVMTALLRQFGLTVLLSGMNTGIGDTLFGLAAMDYSRDAEREADEYSRARMLESGISPTGAAEFFERLSARIDYDEDSLLGWAASHPGPGERAEAYREAAEGRTFTPVLTEQEFGALKTMCEEDEDVEVMQSIV